MAKDILDTVQHINNLKTSPLIMNKEIMNEIGIKNGRNVLIMEYE